MRTEKEIKEKYEKVFQEGGFTDDLDGKLIIHSELKILKWILKDGETEESVE